MSQIVHLSLTLPCHMLVPTLLPLQPGHGVTRVSPQTFLLGHLVIFIYRPNIERDTMM